MADKSPFYHFTQRMTSIPDSGEDDEHAHAFRLRLKQRRDDFAGSNVNAILVSKFVEYEVLTTPRGPSVSKFVEYDVLTTPLGPSISKFVEYVVLINNAAPAPNTERIRHMRQTHAEELADADGDPIANLTRRRKVRTQIDPAKARLTATIVGTWATGPTPRAQLTQLTNSTWAYETATARATAVLTGVWTANTDGGAERLSAVLTNTWVTTGAKALLSAMEFGTWATGTATARASAVNVFTWITGQSIDNKAVLTKAQASTWAANTNPPARLSTVVVSVWTTVEGTFYSPNFYPTRRPRSLEEQDGMEEAHHARNLRSLRRFALAPSPPPPVFTGNSFFPIIVMS